MRPERIPWKVFVGLWLALSLTGLAATPSAATPIAEVDYLETSLGGGLFRYDFTVSNRSNVTESGFRLFDVLVTLDPAAILVRLGLPSGWEEIHGTGFVDLFSLSPGSDVLAGQTLDLFSFQSTVQLGDRPFDALFTNPDDAANPVLVHGTTALAPVPEPSTVTLVLLGLAGVGGAIYRRRRPS